MALTYATLTQAIQDYTENDEATFVSNIPVFVRDCERTVYTSVQIPQLRKVNTSTTLTPSDRYYSLPTDFLAPYEFLITSSGSTQVTLIQKDASWLREAFPDPTVTGVPKYYAMLDSTVTVPRIMVAKTPASGYAVELRYYFHPESIVTASTTWLGNNYENVLLWGSLLNAYIFMKGEKDLIDMYDAQFKQGISLLKRLGDGMERMDTYRVEQTRIKVA